MFHIKQIKIKRFGPFIDAEICPEKGEVSVVLGENQTDTGQQSNGAGKSFILEAVYFALTGNSLRNVPNKELINKISKEATVTLSLLSAHKALSIARSITNKGSILIVNENAQERHFANQIEGNKFILDALGLSLEDLQNFFLVSKGKSQSFFSAPDRQKKALIMRVSNASVVDSAIADVKTDSQSADLRLNELKIKVEMAGGQLSKLEDSLNNIDSAVEIERQRALIDIKIAGLQKDITSHKQSIHDTGEGMVKLRSEIAELLPQANIKHSDIKELALENLAVKEENARKATLMSKTFYDVAVYKHDVMVVNTADIEAHQQKAARLNREHASLLKEKDNTIACPKCTHKFHLGIVEIKKQIATNRTALQATLKEEQQARLKLTKWIDGLQAVKLKKKEDYDNAKKISDRLTLLYKKELAELEHRKWLIKLLKEKNLQLAAMELSITRKNHDLTACRESIEALQIQKEAVSSSSHRETMRRSCEKLLQAARTDLVNYTEQHQGQEAKANDLRCLLLDFETFKHSVCTQSILLIEAEANSLLQATSPFTLDLSSYKEGSVGKQIDRITPYVHKAGRRIPFESLSQGERARVEVATIVSIQKLLSKGDKGLDLLVIDEIAESCDEKGFVALASALGTLKKTIMLINHSAAEASFGNTIKIVKADGVSRIL